MESKYIFWLAKIIEAGKAGDVGKMNSYAGMVAAALDETGAEAGASRIRRAGSGEKGRLYRLQSEEVEAKLRSVAT